MNYHISDRMSSLQPSAIREILKVTADPTVISLAAGNPAPETFPAAEMASIAADIFANDAPTALQYGVSEGYEPLRQLTVERLSKKYGLVQPYDRLIITSGGQQAIELTAKTLLNEGDVVLCEDPSFIGALNALRSYNVKLVGIPCGHEGMDIDALEAALRENPGARLIYTIPTFQNPSGSVMPAEARRRLLGLAERYGVMILEDSPYFELHYDGGLVPPIKSMDTKGLVIYAGSYSKVISPGIRIGFALAPEGLISKMTVAKQVSDVHSNLFFQTIVARYLTEYDIDAHIEKCRAIYHKKRDVMVDALRRHCPEMDFQVPQGGLFLWCDLPGRIDGMDFCRQAGTKKVAAVPGASFMVDESLVSCSVRLNFSLPSTELIKEGVRRLGETLHEMCRK